MSIRRRMTTLLRRPAWLLPAVLVAAAILQSPASGQLVLPAPEFETDYQRPEMSMPAAEGTVRDAIYVGVVIAAMIAAIYFVHYRRSRKAVSLLSVISLALLGFWLLGCICPIGAVQNVSRAVADQSYLLPWAAVIVLAAPLAAALFFGRVFCGGVCPLGAVQDLVLLRPVRVPQWIEKPLGLLAPAYLVLAVVLASCGGPFIICQYDPFVGLFRLSGEAWLIVAGLGLLALGTVVARPYCRFLCPYGVLLGFCSSVSRKPVTACPEGQCVNCRLCENACPVGAIRPPTDQAGDHPVRGRHPAAWLLVMVPFVLAGAGWLAGPAVARLHPTVELWREVERDAGEPQDVRPEAVEAFYMSASNTPEASSVYDRFRLGMMIAGAFVGLVVAVQASIQIRRPVRLSFGINQRACLACGRCSQYCPVEQKRRRKKAASGRATVPRRKAAEGAAAASVASGVGARVGADRAGLALTLKRLALISGVFSLAVAGALVVAWARAEHYPLLEWPQMQALQEARRASPADTAIVDEIRALDAHYRVQYLGRQQMLRTGGLLLAGGLLATLGLLRWRSSITAELPQMPPGGPEFMDRAVSEHHAARGGVLAFGVAALVAMLAAGIALPEIRRPVAPPDEAPVAAVPNWPRFRGPTGDGRVPDGQWPQWWDGPSGAGIRWKRPLPLEGKGSPVVWGDRVFVTAADKQKRLLICFSADSGDELWSRELQSPPPTTSQPSDPPDETYTGWAAPSPATDGQFVFVTFANADIACFDFDGNQRWIRNYGPVRSTWGLASSLVLHGNLVILQMDQGSEPEEGLSWLVALDKRSGREVWKQPRPVSGSWTTPIIVPGADIGATADGIITAGNQHTIAYDAATGRQLWQTQGIGADAAPSPVAAGGIVMAAGENGEAFAIRPGGDGGGEPQIIWRWDEGLPATVSLLATPQYYLQIADNGLMTCLRAESGDLLWQHEPGGAAQPSPCLAGDVVYLLLADGKMLRFRLGPMFEPLNVSILGEKTAATPAFSDGRIFIRGKEHLYCIEGAERPADGSDRPPVGDKKQEQDGGAVEVFDPPSDDIFGP